VLDVGGQDIKAIRCDEKGKVTNFLMNDKCAAGTGRGMEVFADLLGVSIFHPYNIPTFPCVACRRFMDNAMIACLVPACPGWEMISWVTPTFAGNFWKH